MLRGWRRRIGRPYRVTVSCPSLFSVLGRPSRPPWLSSRELSSYRLEQPQQDGRAHQSYAEEGEGDCGDQPDGETEGRYEEELVEEEAQSVDRRADRERVPDPVRPCERDLKGPHRIDEAQDHY